MKYVETSGKSVEAAIKNGLTELGCDISDVDIEILEPGSPGLFGMFGKLAKVRVTMKEKEEDFRIELPKLSLDADKPAKKEKQAPKKNAEQPREEEPAGEINEAIPEAIEEEATEEKPQREPRRERQPRRRRRHENASPVQEKEEEEVIEPAPVEEEPFEAVPEAEWNDAARLAVEFLRNTTSMMGVEVSMEVSQSEEALRIRMNGDALGVLIGRRGETLDALQYLTSLYVNKDREGYLRVSLDSESYRAKREESLRRLAVRMAQRARKNGRRVVLEPMNPYERRILHSALQNNPYVETHSEGEDPFRRVIITLK